jgi:hypothetical protein
MFQSQEHSLGGCTGILLGVCMYGWMLCVNHTVGFTLRKGSIVCIRCNKLFARLSRLPAFID